MHKKKQVFGIKLFSFLFFAGLGFYIPFISVHFKKGLGFSGTQMGVILSIFPILSMFSQALTGFLSDLTGRIRIFLYIPLLSLIFSLVLLFFTSSFWAVLFSFIFFSLSLAAIFPMMNLGILEFLGEKSHNYGKLRAWGSWGFLFSSAVLSGLLDYTGKQYLFVFFALFCFLGLFTIRFFPEREKKKEKYHRKHLKLFKAIDFWFLIVVTFLFQISYSSLDVYLGVLMESLGASSSQIGLAWAVGVAVEIPVMLYSGTIIKRLGVNRFISMGILSGLARWLVYFFAENLIPIYVVQVLHGLTFACLYNGGIEYVRQRFPEVVQGSAQSLYDGSSRLFGYFTGMLIMGRIFDAAGLRGVFATASTLALLALLGMIIFYLFQRKRKLSAG